MTLYIYIDIDIDIDNVLSKNNKPSNFRTKHWSEINHNAHERLQC